MNTKEFTTIKQLSKFSDSVPKNEYYFYQDPDMLINEELNRNGITIYYELSLAGGGEDFGMRYKDVIQQIYPGKKFNSCFEWCSGPGFIGFDLLSAGLCDQLYLADIYTPALNAVEKTIKNLPEQYQGRVNYAKIKQIKDLPTDWKFDLVVANPPHWNPSIQTMISQIAFRDRICTDVDWKIHQEFFSNILEHLNDDGVILLQEMSYASGPEMFRPSIERAGLTIVDCHWDDTFPGFYYLEVKKK